MSKDSEILTVEEVMDFLYVGRNAIYKLLDSRQIKAFKIGKAWKIPRKSLDEYINSKCK